MRWGPLRASGHVTMKPSIRNRGVLYKSGVYAGKVLCLTPGDLLCVPPVAGLNVEGSPLMAGEKPAEGIVVLWDEGPNGKGEGRRHNQTR